jgi:hypothetical protein
LAAARSPRNAGGPLGAADEAVGVIDRLARCFCDSRSDALIEHDVGHFLFAKNPRTKR